MTIKQLLTTRHSTQAFLDKPVAKKTIAELLDIARLASSGANTQSWQVGLLIGSVLKNTDAGGYRKRVGELSPGVIGRIP